MNRTHSTRSFISTSPGTASITAVDRQDANDIPLSAGSSRRADRGKTTYLTPRGKATIFAGPEGIKIQKITDGTSNTIFVVDAGDDRAVTWTRPDDWDVEPKLDLKGIFGHHPGGTTFSFADGSVRFIKDMWIRRCSRSC